MESLLILIPIAVILVIVAVRLLFWAIRSGQYDDLDTEGMRILFDDESKPRENKKASRIEVDESNNSSESR